MSSVPDDAASADVGTQSERTYLAWQRTGLAFLGVGALLVHVAGGLTRPLAAVPGLLGMATSAVIFTRGVLRYRLSSSVAAREQVSAASSAVVGVTLAATVVCVAGLVVILVPS